MPVASTTWPGCTSRWETTRGEPLYRQASQIFEQALGEQHPDYAQSLNNLAALYGRMGNYLRAEPLLQQALEIRKHVLGEQHPDYAQSLNNLAALYDRMGNYMRAEPLLQQALEIRKHVLGEQHPDYADSLSSLAMLYVSLAAYTRAEPLYRQALEIRKHVLREQHPDYATNLNNLGVVYRLMGDYARAEPLSQQASEIHKQVLGEQHPDYATSLSNLAVVYQSGNQPAMALEYRLEALEVEHANANNVLGFTAEPVMHAYLETINGSLPVLISMAAAQQAPVGATDAACLWTLRRKAILLDTLCRFREAQRLMQQDDAVRDRVVRLRGLRQQLSNLALNPPRSLNAEQVQEQRDALREEAERLEAELHRMLSAARSEESPREFDLESVRKRLPSGCVLVELLRVPMFDFHATGKEPRWKPAHYFAFILTPDADRPPQMLDLGDAEAIDDAVQDWRQAVASNSLDFIDLSILRGLVWEPLAQHVADARTILISPDGELNRLPFEALVDENDNYLIERYQFAYLSSGRDLLRSFVEPAEGAVVMADPDYDLGAQERQEAAQTLLASLGGVEVALRGGLSQDVRGLNWERLPGFAGEAQQIQSSLQGTRFAPVQSFLGAEALEEILKSLRAPRILHLITHGFFVADQPLVLDDGPGFSSDDRSAGAALGLARLRGTENPLLRSGLVLAGANALGDETATEVEGDDGWVTAEEISQMDLRGTELVVLSACETGLGDVRTGEGVYGLRRAFFHAGAKTLITSLFKVPDEATSLLMRRFYRSLCAKDMTPLESLREAQLFVLNGGEDPSVDEVPADAERRPPRDWAAFVLSGNWR